MCGIFGFVRGKNGNGPTLENIREMAVGAEVRGTHAFGVAWVDKDGRLHSYKQAGRISQHLDVLDLCRGARAVIGHTRWATHGAVSDNSNNHPHPVDGGWLVHNGIVSNYAELIRQHRLLPQTRCDSEVLGLLIEKYRGTMLKRVVRTVNSVALDAPLTMAALWARPGRLLLVRRGNPLHWSSGRSGNFYFSSCRAGLPGVAKVAPDNAAWEYEIGFEKVKVRSVKARVVEVGRHYEGSTGFTTTVSRDLGTGRDTAGLWAEGFDDPQDWPEGFGDIDSAESADGITIAGDDDPDPNDAEAVTEAIAALNRDAAGMEREVANLQRDVRDEAHRQHLQPDGKPLGKARKLERGGGR